MITFQTYCDNVLAQKFPQDPIELEDLPPYIRQDVSRYLPMIDHPQAVCVRDALKFFYKNSSRTDGINSVIEFIISNKLQVALPYQKRFAGPSGAFDIGFNQQVAAEINFLASHPNLHEALMKPLENADPALIKCYFAHPDFFKNFDVRWCDKLTVLRLMCATERDLVSPDDLDFILNSLCLYDAIQADQIPMKYHAFRINWQKYDQNERIKHRLLALTVSQDDYFIGIPLKLNPIGKMLNRR